MSEAWKLASPLNVLPLLFRRGCCPRVQEAAMVAAEDSRGWTALTYAVASGRPAVVKAIVALIERTVAADQVGVRPSVAIFPLHHLHQRLLCLKRRYTP